jgi:hypothetical protein
MGVETPIAWLVWRRKRPSKPFWAQNASSPSREKRRKKKERPARLVTDQTGLQEGVLAYCGGMFFHVMFIYHRDTNAGTMNGI